MSSKIFALLFGALLLCGAQADLENRLAAAIHKETVAGDLEGAIMEFKAIAAESEQNRVLAAKALSHAAESLEKLGRTSEAQAVRQRIAREFSDQAAVTAQSLTRSSAMAVTGTMVQPQPANLSLTDGVEGSVPQMWFVPQSLADAGYSAELRRTGCGSSPSCAVVITPAKPVERKFGNLMRSIDATPFRGKTLRLRARLRLESKAAGDKAQMWFRVDRPDRQMGFFDNMDNRPVVTASWTDAEIVGPIAADAQAIALGVISIGSGRAWVEAMTLETVSDDTKSTARQQTGPGFGVATATFPVSAAAGKTVKFSGYIKTEGITQGYAGLWWRADVGKSVGAFDNMNDRGPKRTTNWTRYEIQLTIPADATNINFGVLHPGNGTAWFDSLAVEINGVPYHDPAAKFDLDFENLSGYYTGGSGFEVGLDSKVAHSGRYSFKSRFTSATLPAEQKGPAFGVATFTFPVSDAKGKRARFIGYIKTEKMTDGYAGLWWRVDGERDGKRAVLAFDNMSSRGVTGTSDWRRFEINLPVAADATNINFGVLVTGKGTAWFDGLTIDLDGAPYLNKSAFDLEFPGTTVRGAYVGGEGYRVEVDAAQAMTRGGRSLRIGHAGVQK